VNRYTTPAAPTAPTAEPWITETRVPVGESRVTTHVIVPAMQALIAMILLSADVLLWGWKPVAGIIGAVGIGIWVWRVLLGDSLLWRLETITGRDLDGDGTEGQPEHPFVLSNKADAQRKARESAEQAWRQSRAEELARFAAVCATQGTSEKKQGITSESQREKYILRRDALLELGLAAWNDAARPSLGWSLVATPEVTAEIIMNHAL
jgi:hypothetical protein